MAKTRAFLASGLKGDPGRQTAVVAQGGCAMLMTMTPFPQLAIYIGFTLNVFAVMSVASLMIFRRRKGWQKLRVVSFAYPFVPVSLLRVGVWMIIRGMQFKPLISLAAAVTLVTGALVYHFRLRMRHAPAPTVETY